MCLFVRYNKDRERCFKDENVKSYVLRIIYIIFVMSIPIVFSAGIALMKSPGQWRGKRPEVVIIISSIQMLFGIVLTVFALYAIRFLNQYGRYKIEWIICYYNVFLLSTLVLGASVYSGSKSLHFLAKPDDPDFCNQYYLQIWKEGFLDDVIQTENTYYRNNICKPIPPTFKNNYLNEDSGEVMGYLESEYSCSGLCRQLSCFLFTSQPQSEVRGNCYTIVIKSIQNYLFFCTIPGGLSAVVLMFAVVILYFLINQLVNDPETINYVETHCETKGLIQPAIKKPGIFPNLPTKQDKEAAATQIKATEQETLEALERIAQQQQYHSNKLIRNFNSQNPRK